MVWYDDEMAFDVHGVLSIWPFQRQELVVLDHHPSKLMAGVRHPGRTGHSLQPPLRDKYMILLVSHRWLSNCCACVERTSSESNFPQPTRR